MLSKKQEKLLSEHLSKAVSLPEDEKLFKDEYPGPGYHKHDENNAFGMHRHHLGDKVDGAHVHSPQNPEGEHVHGEHEGMALIDGAHTHKNSQLGYHYHESEENENFGEIQIQKPGQVLPETNPDTPARE